MITDHTRRKKIFHAASPERLDTINETGEIPIGVGNEQITRMACGASDTIIMTDGISKTEPVIVKQNDDLYIFIDSNNYLKVINQFNQPNCGVPRLEVSDGCYITRLDIENIVNTMSEINNNDGMDIIQKFNAMRNDQAYINILADSWSHQRC